MKRTRLFALTTVLCSVTALFYAASCSPRKTTPEHPKTAITPPAVSRAAVKLERSGNEIMVAGQLFDIGTPVVLWTDPGGFDAYRVERRFAPWEESSFRATQRASTTQPKSIDIGSPNRINLRYRVLNDAEIEQVRGGGWPLEMLQEKVDQFVIHYDVAGTSANCFKVLHDSRGLSVQFMLDIDGTIYQTCDAKEACSHATKANHRSVGIEIANMGSYSSGEPAAYKAWYGMDEQGPFIKVPERLQKYIRTPNFVGRPARPEMVVGEIRGRRQRQYDYTPQQYEALVKLTAGLCTVLPKIKADYPRDEQGNLIARTLTPEEYDAYQGVLGHYHVQTNKSDPGVAFQWDYVIDRARQRMGLPTKPPGGNVDTKRPAAETQPTTAPDTQPAAAPIAEPTSQPVTQPVADSADPAAALARRLDQILHRLDKGDVHYASRIVELSTGRELYARDVDRPMIPASNGKIAVSAAVLDRFGPDHKFQTFLAMDGDDLWLIGTGDPAPGDLKLAKQNGGGTTVTMLDKWADALKAKGVERVKGNLYYYAGSFDDETIHPSWSRGYLTDWYAAPVTGLNFNDNCIDTTVSPAADPGEPAAFVVVPPTEMVKVVNKTVTKQPGLADHAPADAPADARDAGDSRSRRRAPAIDREADANAFTLSGEIAKPTELESKPVTDPALFFADALRTHLASRGIAIDGETRKADKPLGGEPIPPQDKIVAVHETAMPDVLWRINKSSQNLFAEAVCKYLGRQYRLDHGVDEPGSWKAGSDAVHAFLSKHHIDDSPLVVADGSGLSRQNRVTTRLISDVFVKMHAHPHGEVFRKSLAEAGVDGTIGKRMKDMAGHVFAKTGYIGGVRSLSGYVKTKSGEWLVFSIIFNGIPGDVKPYEALQDEAVRTLHEWPNVPATSAAPATAPAGS